MPDFTVRSDSINVEQIMEQIRTRIREKRGVDYTEQELQELAAVKLEKFLDPRGVRSDLLEQFRRSRPPLVQPELPKYTFGEETLYETHRGLLRLIRKLLQPILKLLFNPNPLIQALHIQTRINALYPEREARAEITRRNLDVLHYEVLHNLVVETTRMGIEVKNLKMRVESLTSRLEFNERRARALESVVVYKPSLDERVDMPRKDARDVREPRESQERRAEEVPPVRETMAAASSGVSTQEGPGQRSRRRRRRRGRRGSGSVSGIMGQPEAHTASSSPNVEDVGDPGRHQVGQMESPAGSESMADFDPSDSAASDEES